MTQRRAPEALDKPNRQLDRTGSSPVATAAFVGSDRLRDRMAAIAFFLSGAGSLVFEIVWFYRCGLVLGNAVWATTAVLSSFMAGLAVGNVIAAGLGHRIRRFLRTYAVLEAVIGTAGIAATYLLSDLNGLVWFSLRRTGDLSWTEEIVRFSLAFGLLIVPASAMGATLPVLVAALSRGRTGFGRVLGRLYGWNTIGAVVGVIGTELLLIPRVGVTGATWVAGLLNLSAAATAVWISSWWPAAAWSSNPAPGRPTWTSRAVRVLAAACICGIVLMLLEVVWFRFISLFVLNSTRALSLMLAVVLGAVGLGGLTGSAWIKRGRGASTYAAAVSFAAGLLTVASYRIFQPLTNGPSSAQWHRPIWLALTLTTWTSLASGVLFTLFGDAIKREVGTDSRAAGYLLLANTIGAAVGPVIATFLLVPRLGMEKTIFAAALGYGVAGLLAAASPHERTPASTRTGVAALALYTIVLAAFPFGMMSHVYFARAAATYTSDGSHFVATREGTTETIFLLRQSWGGHTVYDRLVTNGFSMSGTHLSGQRYMRAFVYWPAVLHPAPLRHVLVVCYGVGVTASAAANLASVESIDIAEISRDIVAVSDLVDRRGEQPLADPRVKLHIEDGRQFLALTNQQFDLITGEPPPPLTPGTVSLYTREYFQLVHDRLADGGFATYWLPIAQKGEYDIVPIIRAFCDVFEDCSLWNGTPFDWILVGSRGRRVPQTADGFTRLWSDPQTGPHLRAIGFEVPEQLGATFLGDAHFLNSLASGTPPVTDDHPARLLGAGPQRIALDPADQSSVVPYARVLDTSRARRAFEESTYIRKLWPEDLRQRTLAYFGAEQVINRVLSEGAKPLGRIEELDALLTKTSLRRLPLWALGTNDVIQDIADKLDAGNPMVTYELGLRALAIRNYPAAARYLAAAEQRGLQVPAIRPLRAYALCLAGQCEAARALTPKAPSDPDEGHFWGWLIRRFELVPESH